ncbi:MAG TPA: hypothetical protein GXX60_04095 [Anaerolineaceae bacterium]|nr:hypothetical protein [Anaerolineaceae bacterium]
MMVHRKRISTAFLLALVCSVLVIGSVFSASGIQHANFQNTYGLNSAGGWGKTRVLSPGSAYRPQVNCELQNNAGATISTAADWGYYGASQAYAYCSNKTGASPTRLWLTHNHCVNGSCEAFYYTLP